MRLIFCGTPQFAVPSLQHLLARPEFEILAVITQPDRPSGRGHELSFSPVKQTALASSIPIHQPEKIRSAETQALLTHLSPDAIVIIAYGQIIPASLLPIPKHGWINLHASLLPKYRGAAPINWAIANGEFSTGLTTMRIDAGMDTGEILLQQELAIGSAETAPELAERLSQAGAPLIAETLRKLRAGAIRPQPQDNQAATYAPILKKETGRIDWNLTADQIYNRIRAFDPWPGAFTTFRSRTCHIWGEPVSNISMEAGAPGTLHLQDKQLYILCGGTTHLRLTAVKVEGRNRISPLEFANGARLTKKERFGDT